MAGKRDRPIEAGAGRRELFVPVRVDVRQRKRRRRVSMTPTSVNLVGPDVVASRKTIEVGGVRDVVAAAISMRVGGYMGLDGMTWIVPLGVV